MKISIYQVVPELDEKGILFRDLTCAKKAGNGRVLSEIYECIYSGELTVTDPEQVFVMCNCEQPEGYKGHSLSVSDVVEFQYGTGESRFFFCDSLGFSEVVFDANKAMLPVSNHDYKYLHEYRRIVKVYFMTADGLQDRFCESLLFSRCRYSRSQLGYRLECQSYGSTEPQIFVFAEFPRVIVTESITVFPEHADKKDQHQRRDKVRHRRVFELRNPECVQKLNQPAAGRKIADHLRRQNRHQNPRKRIHGKQYDKQRCPDHR